METLSGKLVTLKPERDEDAEFVADLRNDLRTQAWNQRIPPCVTPEIIKERLKKGLERPNTGFFLIESKDGEKVGYLNYTERPPRFGATVGIATSMDYWGKGHPMEAMELLLEFLFEERGLQVIWAWTQAGNKRAVGAAEKMGFKKSAWIRESAIIDGEVHDTLMMDLLREEYYESRGKEDRIGHTL